MTSERTARANALEAQVKGKVCLRCNSQPRVAWIQGDWTLRCNCKDYLHPILGDQAHPIAARQWQMAQAGLKQAELVGDAMDGIKDLYP